jgi:hypothetical protein
MTAAHPIPQAHHPTQFVALDKVAMGHLIDAICKCSDEFDDGVHLQVMLFTYLFHLRLSLTSFARRSSKHC